MMNINLKKNKGYTLLFSVLVSSIVLSIGISILTISKKEFLLSSSARESMNAFYAADGAVECAMYNDTLGSFATSSANTHTIYCMGVPITASLITDGIIGTTTFQTRLHESSSACAMVTVAKTRVLDVSLGAIVPMTTIVSKGYNMGWNSTTLTCTDPSPRRVERAILYTY